MTKKVLCEIDGFKGFVHFYEPLNLDQVFAIEDAQDKASEAEPSSFLSRLNEARGMTETRVVWSSRVQVHILPAIIKCVEKFEIDGIPEKPTADNFPMTPRGKITSLVDWLFNQLLEIYSGETTIPNAS